MANVVKPHGAVKPFHGLTPSPEPPGPYNKKEEVTPWISPVIIDKLSLFFTMSDAEHVEAIREGLKDPKAVKGDVLIGGLFLTKARITKARVRFLLLGPDPDGIVSSLGSKVPGAPTFHVELWANGICRFDWNPSKWDAGQRAHLWPGLARILLTPPEGEAHNLGGYSGPPLSRLLAHATITRVDAAVDVFGIPLDTVSFWDDKPDRKVYDRVDGLGTVYQGKLAKTGNRFLAYDKTRERREALADRKGMDTAARAAACAAMPDPWIRLEVVRTNPNLRGECLAGLPNPFKAIRCAIPATAFPAANYPPPDGRGTLALLMAVVGVPRALAAIPCPVLRGKLTTALNGATPDWWNPTRIWKGWPDAVRDVLPSPAPACN